MILNRNLLIITLLFISTLTFSQDKEKEDGFNIGGAIRYNLLSEFYGNPASNLNPKFTWDTWRLNVDGSMSGIDLSFEYRFYPTFGTHFIHHGYLGYSFSENVYMKLGVTQVPFGITPFASHSWWFQGAYYVGLEDDYDMGISFDIQPADNITVNLAYFRQAEPEGPRFGGESTYGNAGAGRYSYDIVPDPTMNSSNRELNQFNARVAWNATEDWELGISAQAGSIYNSVVDDSKTATAFAGHVVGDFGNFNLKAEFINYNYRALGDNGQILDVIQMGAYGDTYYSGEGYTGGVATQANIFMAGLSYTIPVDFGPVSGIQPYIDYTLIDKSNSDFHNTEHLVPGFLVTAGPVYLYVDYAMGKNQPWLTSDFGKGLGSGIEDAEWNKRFNINLGYYF